VLGLHSGALVERGGSPEWGLACATAYGFGRFRAQIKAGVEGSSPRGIPGNGGYQKMACGGKDSALALNNGRRELQWSVSTGSSPNVCSTASASSSGSRCGPSTVRTRRYAWERQLGFSPDFARTPHEACLFIEVLLPDWV
jgi:hypothetical protein